MNNKGRNGKTKSTEELIADLIKQNADIHKTQLVYSAQSDVFNLISAFQKSLLKGKMAELEKKKKIGISMVKNLIKQIGKKKALADFFESPADPKFSEMGKTKLDALCIQLWAVLYEGGEKTVISIGGGDLETQKNKFKAFKKDLGYIASVLGLMCLNLEKEKTSLITFFVKPK